MKSGMTLYVFTNPSQVRQIDPLPNCGCLSATRLGLKAYLIPITCSKCCLRASNQLWEFRDLLEFQKRLYGKHGKNYRHIYASMGEISCLSLKSMEVMKVLGPVYLRLFPNLNTILKEELADCDTVLDIGCGYASPIAGCDVPFSVGIELFEPYLVESQRKSIHSQYIKADIRRLEFKPKSFDAVLAIEVLEHLTKEEGYDLIKRMKDWAVRKIIITAPNGYREQDAYDDNPLQEHKSYWNADELTRLGFKVFGSEGWKRLRGYRGSIKHRPALVWRIVSALTQKITYYYPTKAFQLLAIRNLEESNKR